MGYVTSALPQGSARSIKLAVCKDLTGGVCFESKGPEGDGKSPYMCNLINYGGILRTRDGQTELFSLDALSGELHGYNAKAFNDCVIFHVGTFLYAANPENDSLTLLSDALPDKKSIMTTFSSKLYIYCDRRVFTLDGQFVFAEEIPYAPHLYVNVGMTATPEQDVQINLLAPIITVTFSGITTNGVYSLPLAADSERPFRLYNKDELVSESCYRLSRGRELLVYTSAGISDVADMKVVYYVNEPSKIGFDDSLYNCVLAESFGGDTVSGTRLFMTGDTEHPGRIYISYLLNPLRFDKDSYETVGTCGEDITGFIRQYGRLIVFTKNSVMRMTYSFSDGKSTYTVKELNSQIGCDMPKSIQLIDNRVVFGNSARGIYIIDSTEDFGEQNIKPISANINKGHKNALLMCTKREIQCAFSVDYDRKYYLLVGDKMYVWDYGQCAYSDSGNYAKAQKRLEWYLFDGIRYGALFDCGTRLVCLCMNGKTSITAFASGMGDFGVPVHSRFESEALDLSYPTRLKAAEKLSLDIKGTDEGNITVGVCSADGEYYRTKLCLQHDMTDSNGVVVSLPKKSVSRFSFFAESDQTPFSLESAAIYYRLSHRQY